jgi:hypothetical protein
MFYCHGLPQTIKRLFGESQLQSNLKPKRNVCYEALSSSLQFASSLCLTKPSVDSEDAAIGTKIKSLAGL